MIIEELSHINIKKSYDAFKKQPYMLYEFFDYEEIEDDKGTIDLFIISGREDYINYYTQRFFNGCKISYTRYMIEKNPLFLFKFRITKNKGYYAIEIAIEFTIKDTEDYLLSGIKKYCGEYGIELRVMIDNSRILPHTYSSNKEIKLEFYTMESVYDKNFCNDFSYIEYLGLSLRNGLHNEIFTIFDYYKNNPI